MIISTVSKTGGGDISRRTVIPRQIAAALGAEPGDRLVWRISGDGTITIAKLVDQGGDSA